MAEPRGDSRTLQDYVSVLRRRKWVIILALMVVPAVAVVFSLRQSPLYASSAQVLMSNQDLAGALTNTQSTSASLPDREAQTQADIAHTPTVAAKVIADLKLKDKTPEELLKWTSVVPSLASDVIAFHATDPDPELAKKIATQFAVTFTKVRSELDTASLKKARAEVSSRLEDLRATGEDKTAYFRSLQDKEQQLATLEALQTSNATLLRAADKADKVRPKPSRNGGFGVVLGLVLGIGLAFLLDALDTRVRTAEEIREKLGLPMLARLPEPPRDLRGDNRLAMIAEPHSVYAESFRILATNLDFVNLEWGARSIMVTSSVQSEGKSTTIANLAVALARSGRRVGLVDLDLRRPYIDRFFKLEERPGLTHVALGRVTLDEALVTFTDIDAGDADETDDFALPGHRPVRGEAPHAPGSLTVLTSGALPPNPGEFVSSRALGEILDDLRDRVDILLIDTPPLLQVGDAMTLSAKVDAMIVVTRFSLIRRPMLAELHRVLETCPAGKLGFVLTGAEAEEGYGYGYSYGYGYVARGYGRSNEKESAL
jgi:succinoglycan biosynthesis transport protein ExoP